MFKGERTDDEISNRCFRRQLKKVFQEIKTINIKCGMFG